MLSRPYLLSSALSPAHYALVNRLECSTSSSEHDIICTEELQKSKGRLRKQRIKDVSSILVLPAARDSAQLISVLVGQAEICEVLVMMMHINMVRSTIEEDGKDEKGKGRIDPGLVHALNLAEGGKELKYRRVG